MQEKSERAPLATPCGGESHFPFRASRRWSPPFLPGFAGPSRRQGSRKKSGSGRNGRLTGEKVVNISASHRLRGLRLSRLCGLVFPISNEEAGSAGDPVAAER